jgi:hypothetical protein
MHLIDIPRRFEDTPHNSFINLQMINSTEVLGFLGYHLKNYQLVSEVIPENLVDRDSLSSEFLIGDKFGF